MEPTKIPCLATGISAGLWIDLEAAWALASGRQLGVTCGRSWDSDGGSRRDFIVGCPRAAGAVSRCLVREDPYFCRSGQRETSLEEFTREVNGWPPLLPEVHLPRLTGQMLAEVVHRKGATAGSLDGWVWREFKAFPVSWFGGLARIFSKVEDTGVWPEGLLDACIVLIPKTDGDATPLGQRPVNVVPSAHRIWASVRMLQLEDWLRCWVPDSVFSAGGGRSPVEAWYITSLDF